MNLSNFNSKFLSTNRAKVMLHYSSSRNILLNLSKDSIG